MQNKNFIWVFLLIIGTYFCAIGVDTMDIDASQYANMSREMMVSGSYLQVYDLGKDYLDKPPFLFWITSISMKIFGASNFGFKLPSILFVILALFATYRFTKIFYNQTVAFLATLVLATCQVIFLITNDIRTDAILMAWVILACWQLARWIQTNKTSAFLLGCLAIGGGMLTKGPIALFVPVFAFGSHLLIQRKFNYIFKPIYLSGIVLIGLVLLPMCIGLYTQFDLHPEKIVNDARGVSGLRFFFWTQSFGRITGESIWNNHVSFTFLFENLLWGFLPWILFLISGLIKNILDLIRNRLKLPATEEFITTGGFIITYCSLGISKYQLPHYIYVVLPFAAIISAKMIYSLFWENRFTILKNVIVIIQGIVLAAMCAFPFVILKLSFPSDKIGIWLIPIIVSVLGILILVLPRIKKKIIVLSVSLIIGLNIFLSLWFYPQLLNYQASNNIGRFIKANNIPADKFNIYKFNGNTLSMHFYSNRIVPEIQDLNLTSPKSYLLTSEEGLNLIRKEGRNFEIVKEGPDFHVSTLNAGFLNRKTRGQNVKQFYIIQLE